MYLMDFKIVYCRLVVTYIQIIQVLSLKLKYVHIGKLEGNEKKHVRHWKRTQ